MRKIVYVATIALAVASAASWARSNIGAAPAVDEPSSIDVLALQAAAKDLPVTALVSAI